MEKLLVGTFLHGVTLTSGMVNGSRQISCVPISRPPCCSSCSLSTSWKNTERILSTSTLHRMATVSLSDCKRISTTDTCRVQMEET